MGIKLLWTGLTIALIPFGTRLPSVVVGSIIMIVGAVLLWLDK